MIIEHGRRQVYITVTCKAGGMYSSLCQSLQKIIGKNCGDNDYSSYVGQRYLTRQQAEELAHELRRQFNVNVELSEMGGEWFE